MLFFIFLTFFRVCHRWNILTKCMELQKQIVIDHSLLPSQLIGLIQHHFSSVLEDFQYEPRNITYLSDRMPIDSLNLSDIARQCDNLKTLVLKFCSLNAVALKDFPRTLNHLSIRDCTVDSVPFFGLNPSNYLPHLVCLDLGSVKDDLTSLELHRLNSLKTLKALYMEGCKRINSGGIESIHQLLQQLEILDVEGTDISDEGATFIMYNSPKMKKLYLGHTEIDDRFLQDASLNLMPDLNYLCILGSKITYTGLQNSSQGFAPSAVLTVKAYPKHMFNFQYPLKLSCPEDPGKCKHYLSHKY